MHASTFLLFLFKTQTSIGSIAFDGWNNLAYLCGNRTLNATMEDNANTMAFSQGGTTLTI